MSASCDVLSYAALYSPCVCLLYRYQVKFMAMDEEEDDQDAPAETTESKLDDMGEISSR